MKNRQSFRLLISDISAVKLMLIFMVITGSSVINDLRGQVAEAFKPGGKPEARIFTSLGTTFSNGENHNKFDLTRAYLGYGYNFSQRLSARIVYDVADPSAGKLKFTGMLKFALLKYQTDRWTITGGMIPLPEYDYGDKKWGYRYVFKPSHDEYGFGTSADLGLSAAYKINSWMSADMTIMNGEGYKLTEADSTFKTAAGITLLPLKNLSLRGYYDIMTGSGINQHTTEIIASYESKQFTLSMAYNYRKNQNLEEGRDYQGISFNGTVTLSEKMRLFGRYDYVTSTIAGNGHESWNQNKDGRLFIAGLEFALAPGVNISPNYQGWNPAGPEMSFISRFLLSLDLKL